MFNRPFLYLIIMSCFLCLSADKLDVMQIPISGRSAAVGLWSKETSGAPEREDAVVEQI